MADLIKASTELYGDCSQEVGSTDIYIKGVLATSAQMTAITTKATAAEVTQLEATRKASIKQAANKRIISRYKFSPDDPADVPLQANMTMRGVEFTLKRVMVQTLTTAELAEEQMLINAGIWIKATRAASNVAEATAGMQASEIVWPL
jgi:hypothetical protein